MSKASAAAVVQAGITLVEQFKKTTAIHAEVDALDLTLIEHAAAPDEDTQPPAGDGTQPPAGDDTQQGQSTQ